MRMLLAVVSLLHAVATPASENSPIDPALLIEAGRRIYEQGLLPNGEPLLALRAGGLTMRGDQAACALCHRRSGFGQVEGRSLVPPVAGNVLFAPGRYFGKQPPQGATAPGMKVIASRLESRPAYDAASLDRALRDAVDPSGRRFDDLMPRYELDEFASAALTAYLRQLSATTPPGVSADALHVATIVAPGMSAARRKAMLDTLEPSFGRPRTGRRWILHVWDLDGPPENWEKQLDRLYASEPVFAVLSGLGGSDWAPVHRFCERNRVPCVLPNIELAPAAEHDFYSLYFSGGLTTEAGALAKLLSDPDTVRPARVVQVHGDASGERAAASLREAIGGAVPVETRKYDAATPKEALAGLAAGDVLVLWLRPEALSALAAAAPDGLPVSSVYLSAMLAPPEDTRLPATWRPIAGFVTVFDDPARIRGQASMALIPWLKDKGRTLTDLRIQADTYAAAYFFARALAHRNAQINREWLIERLESIETTVSAAGYPLLSLGPGQRQAVKSAGILRYRAPQFTQLHPAGRRIVPD